eukprot:TRINITY_DN1986_c0_g2_i4.p1 TRINITY_DN1986_c0_g2~~TRINITY_DN1986_c0_g2_i4.p1  ORF type:complete len:298 (+),score=102.12 TRINITY_DN1986_c0_g2_i4:354-1247(+)
MASKYPKLDFTTDPSDVYDNQDIQAVVVVTPATVHYRVVKSCLEKGKHVLVEKPITVDVEQGQELVDLAAEKGLCLMVGHTFLHNSSVEKVKEVISDDTFGSLYYLNAVRTNLGPFRDDVNASWDLAPHDISMFLYLTESKVDWVSATGSKILGTDLYDVSFVTCHFENGVVGHIHVSWIEPNKVRELTCVGSGQRVTFNDTSTTEKVRIFSKGVSVKKEDTDGSLGSFNFQVRDGDIVSPYITPAEPLKTQALEFARCVNNGETPFSDGQLGVDVVKILVAADESMDNNGAPVYLK